MFSKVYLPRGHSPGLIVPRGGSSCANCRFVDLENNSCKNSNYINWNGGNPKLPAPANRYCSDWWEHK